MTRAAHHRLVGRHQVMATTVEVGIDEAGPITPAVFWAAGEAHRRGVTLRLVHGYTLPITGVNGEIVYPASIFDADRARMAKMLEHISDILVVDYPGLRVQWLLRYGEAVDVMASRSREAAMAVVGAHVGHHWLRSIFGSVASELTRHQECPIVVVRSDPLTGAVRYDGPVVVAIEDPDQCDDIVEFAFTEAALRGVPVVALHCDTSENTGPDALGGSPASAFSTAAVAHPEIPTKYVALQSNSGQDHAERRSPVELILKYCRHPQRCVLLVVGTSSPRPIVSLSDRSGISALINGLSCPLATVPHG